jgi:hypothetical protein
MSSMIVSSVLVAPARRYPPHALLSNPENYTSQQPHEKKRATNENRREENAKKKNPTFRGRQRVVFNLGTSINTRGVLFVFVWCV